MISDIVPRLIHCFGNERNIVTTKTVIEMLNASKSKIIPINTHNINEINKWEELPIGYGKCNWKELSSNMNTQDYIPIWNINLQTNADEAVRRAIKAISLGGKRAIKLEVLNNDLNWSNNRELIKATEKLVKDYNLEVWPLIAPDKDAIDTLIKVGCPLIRIMGSKINSGAGISREAINMLKYIKENYKNIKVMLDGGVGSQRDVYIALVEGFDSVLVNSYLFKTQHGPVIELNEIMEVS